MSLLLLEALGAMVLLLLIVWWTMFSGRTNGELPARPPESAPPAARDDAPDSAAITDKT